jgi:hypothetical protein
VEIVVDISTDQLVLQAAFYDDGSQAANIESMLLQFESEARGVMTSGVPHAVVVPQKSLVNRVEPTPPVVTADGTHNSDGERDISVAMNSVRRIIAQFWVLILNGYGREHHLLRWVSIRSGQWGFHEHLRKKDTT